MFADVIKDAEADLKALKALLVPTKGAIISITAVLEKIDAAIASTLDNIAALKERLSNAGTAVAVDMANKAYPKLTLLSEINKAISINTEFDIPLFRSGLVKAATSPDLIIMSVSGNVLTVDIRMDEVAGSIAEYAAAVKAVREELKGISSTAQASNYWKRALYQTAREGKTLKKVVKYRDRRSGEEKFRTTDQDITKELAAKYWITMAMRFELLTKPAPFWEILDKGSAAIDTGSGTPYPSNSPTNFVENTINRIKEKFTMELTRLREELKSYILSLERHLKSLYLLRERALTISKKGESATRANEAELNAIGLSLEKVDREKLSTVMLAIRRGDMTGLKITSEGRIELTPVGGKRYRPTIGKLRKAFGYLEGES